jgi:SAM-dependent methyltransferase
MTDAAERQRWDTRFAGEAYHFGTAPSAFLLAQQHRLRPGMAALSIADGEGRNGVWLARQGLQVVSVDFSAVGLAKAQRLAAEAGVAFETICADLESWDWAVPPVDLVVVIYVQFAAPALRSKIFRHIVEVLNPGGLLLLEGYRPEQLRYKTGGPSQIENLYTTPMLREAFAELEILELVEHDSEVDEGHGHRGMSALIDLVARKPAG